MSKASPGSPAQLRAGGGEGLGAGLAIRLVVAIQVAMGLALGASAHDVGGDDDRRGPYVQLGFTLTFGDDQALDTINEGLAMGLPPPSAGATFREELYTLSNGIGLTVCAGHRFHRHLAAEARVEWTRRSLYVDGIDITVPSAPVTGTQERPGLDRVRIGADLRYLPFSTRLQPFGVLGFGVVHDQIPQAREAPVGATHVAFRLGGGVELPVTSHVVVTLSVVHDFGVGSISELDVTSLGFGTGLRF